MDSSTDISNKNILLIEINYFNTDFENNNSCIFSASQTSNKAAESIKNIV